jgi:hypothetical protein
MFKTDDIELVDYHSLKMNVDGGLLMPRLKYRSELSRLMHS